MSDWRDPSPLLQAPDDPPSHPDEPQASFQLPASLLAGARQELDPDFVPAERLSWLLSSLVFAALQVTGLAVAWIAGGLFGIWLYLAAGLVLSVILLLALATCFWPALAYRRISYRLSSGGLEIRRGVLWRSVVVVPRARIQHTDVSQGPIERRFGLSTLVVHTAGIHDSEISLGGLRRNTAFALRDVLMENHGERDA